MIPVIALVGRPNVGKSTLFNRLTRTRDAIVAEFAGLTRDRQYGKGAMGDFEYLVVDTGGLSGDENGIMGHMADQALYAIEEADLIIFLVDAKDGRTAGDNAIAEMLRSQDKPVLLVGNKIDGQNPDYAMGEFASLGFDDSLFISASNGNGVRSLVNDVIAEHEAILSCLAIEDEAEPENAGIKIAIVGRPNVGKSTLVNRLLGEDRVVVFDEAGTTRDSIFIPYEREGQPYTLIDTAGVRRRGKVKEKVEKFSIIKTLDAIGSTHVVLLLIDAHEGLVDQDLHILTHVLDSGRALVLVINKWDGTSLDQKNHVKNELERRLVFLKFATTHFISALHGSGVGLLYKSIHKAYDSATKKLQTRVINDILSEAVKEHQPPLVHGRRIKLRYAHVGGHNPPIIVIHGNQTSSVPSAYKRYLENRFIKALKLEGTPIRIEFKTSENPFSGKTDKKAKKPKLTDRHLDHKQLSRKKGDKKQKQGKKPQQKKRTR
ncbi:MAG: ribosome biogenesis GTPase Der [Pseudomonadales bacterium]|nr:ribosome biogenesis GTPase Der [Pseudomonadales bacterium]